MLDGVAGNLVSATLRAELPPHELVAVTDKVPEMNVEGMLRVMEFPLLATMEHPPGIIQL